jgi:hypothetical protein
MTAFALYFAYGSNMSAAQMAVRCPGAWADGVSELADWRFLINDRGVATIAPSCGQRVLGVLWHCTAGHLDALDGYEGVALGLYRRERVAVRRLGDGSRVETIAYIEDNVAPGRPRAGYLERILAGAAQHGLDATYRAWLESFAAAD